MPPRSFTNPAPKTESAREAVKSFYCELCNKGYSRQNEYSAHESSYDHQHKKRLKDLKAMSRTMDPSATTKARKAEQKEAGLIKINPIGLGAAKTGAAGAAAGSGFKKGGFKNAFGGAEKDVEAEVEVKAVVDEKSEQAGGVPNIRIVQDAIRESDSEDDGYERYDPRRPTDCGPACRSKR